MYASDYAYEHLKTFEAEILKIFQNFQPQLKN